MMQKTLKTAVKVNPGDEVILISRSYEPLFDKEFFDIVPHKGEGISGNLNSAIKQYHGWRGTTNGCRKDAYGVRKVLKVVDLGEDEQWDSSTYGETLYKVTVGKDIHPEWE